MIRILRDKVKAGEYISSASGYDADRLAISTGRPPLRPSVPAGAEAVIYVPGDRCTVLLRPQNGHGWQEAPYTPSGYDADRKRWNAGDNMLAKVNTLSTEMVKRVAEERAVK